MCIRDRFTVVLEQGPLFWRVPREVPGPVPIGLGGLAGHAEIPDQRFPRRQLLLVLRKADRPSRCIQSRGVPAVQPVGHGAPPLLQGRLEAGLV